MVSFMSYRFGRKPVLFFSIILQPVSALIQAFSVNWFMFCVLNCLRGVGQIANYTTALVLGETTHALQESLSPTSSLIAVRRVKYLLFKSCQVMFWVFSHTYPPSCLSIYTIKLRLLFSLPFHMFLIGCSGLIKYYFFLLHSMCFII